MCACAWPRWRMGYRQCRWPYALHRTADRAMPPQPGGQEGRPFRPLFCRSQRQTDPRPCAGRNQPSPPAAARLAHLSHLCGRRFLPRSGPACGRECLCAHAHGPAGGWAIGNAGGPYALHRTADRAIPPQPDGQEGKKRALFRASWRRAALAWTSRRESDSTPFPRHNATGRRGVGGLREREDVPTVRGYCSSEEELSLVEG